MGITEVDAIVRGPHGQEAQVRFLANSGATYSLLPFETWRALEIEATRRVPTILADGTVIERDVSECLFILPEGQAHSPVFLGEPGDQALLGAVTLETLGLVLNPFTCQLDALAMLLA